MTGLFVTFEGGEGSGKTTQLDRLARRFVALGIEPLVTREPGGTPVAESIRGLLLDPALCPEAMTEALLMVAARADLVSRVVRPALESGRVILCDRYTDSTLAYQGGGRGLDPGFLAELNRVATGGLTPDLTLLYDLEVSIGLGRRHRASAVTSRLDREPAEFHERVRSQYLSLASREPDRFVVLDATLSESVLEERAWAALDRVRRR
jgi:dTMP kinase